MYYFLGNTVTWADLHFTNAVLLLKKLNGYKALDGCPLLRDLDNRNGNTKQHKNTTRL